MVLPLPVVQIHRFLLRNVVRVGCCYCASLEVLYGEENWVAWAAALVLPIFLYQRSCGISQAVL